MKIIKVLICLCFLISCSTNMGYISVVNDGGKKKIIRTQVPDYNKKYISKKEYRKQILVNNYDKNIDLKTRKSINKENNVNENVVDIAKSTAYTNKSVIDNNKKIYEATTHNQEVIRNSLAEEEKSNERIITIADFDYLPSSIFNDPIKQVEKVVETEEEPAPIITKEDILNEEREKNKDINTERTNQNVNELVPVVVENKKVKQSTIEDKKEILKEKKEITKTTDVEKTPENNEVIKEIELEEEVLPVITKEKKPSFFSRLFGRNKVKEKETININEIENAENKEEKVVYSIVEHKDLLNKDEEFKDTIKKEQKNNKNKNLNKVLKNEGISSSNDLTKGKFYLQLGSSRNNKTAIKTLNKFAGVLDNCFILKTPSEDNENVIYNRIICGHFNTKEDAELSKEKIVKMGHYDVFVFKE